MTFCMRTYWPSKTSGSVYFFRVTAVDICFVLERGVGSNQ